MKFTRRTIIYGILILGIVCCLIVIYVDLFERSRDHVHNYGEWTVVSTPECTENGKRERYCGCGSIQENDVSALGHDFVYGEGKQADCTSGGYCGYAACLRCEFTTFEETQPLGHSFGGWELTKEATCISFGEEMRVCLRDPRHVETRQTEKVGHAPVWTVKKAATCENDGVEQGKCAHCDFEEERITEALGHKYGEWSAEIRQTCTTEGLEKRTCANDNSHVQSRITEKTGHTPSGWLTETQAGCTADGTEFVKCTACKERLDERVLPSTGHSSSGWLTEREASCTLNGLEYTKCLNCLERLDERSVASTGHSASGWLTEKTATCEASGAEYIKCLNCLERLDERSVASTGHRFGGWQITFPPSCNSSGERIRVCGNNEAHTEIQSVDKLEHKFVALSNDGLRHKLRCSLCKEEENEAHKWGDNDCAVCGYDGGGTKNIEYASGGDGSYLTVISCGRVNDAVVTVPETYNGVRVGAIGELAFNSFSVTHIYLSENITAVAEGAFAGCDSLQYLKLPFKGESFKNLFVGLTDDVRVPQSLKTVELCEGVTVLRARAFEGCADIAEIILPSTLEVLGDECFSACTSLTEIILPQRLKRIGAGAFWRCSSLKKLTIPEKVEEVGKGAFNGISDEAEILFLKKDGWSLYEPDGKKADALPEEYLNSTNTILLFNNTFAFKRKITEVE